MSRLIPFAGDDRRGRAAVGERKTVLSFNSEENALRLFKLGRDTAEIADILWCTEAAAYNGLTNARERRQ